MAQVVGGLMDKEDWVANLKHLDLVGDLQEMAQVVLVIDLNSKEDWVLDLKGLDLVVDSLKCKVVVLALVILIIMIMLKIMEIIIMNRN